MELKCEKHHTPTQLTCAQCGKPSCTRCLVWTEVGQKCRTCVPNKGGRKRSSIVVPALIAAVLLVVLLAALGVFSSDEKAAEPAKGNVPGQPGIGQPARDGALTFVVTKFGCGAEEVGEGQRIKRALGRYCLLEFKASNTGTQPTTYVSPMQYLLDAQRRRFAPDAQATVLYLSATAPGSPTNVSQQLNPGAEVDTSLVYDIPDGVIPELAELHGGNTLGITVRLTGAAGRF